VEVPVPFPTVLMGDGTGTTVVAVPVPFSTVLMGGGKSRMRPWRLFQLHPKAPRGLLKGVSFVTNAEKGVSFVTNEQKGVSFVTFFLLVELLRKGVSFVTNAQKGVTFVHLSYCTEYVSVGTYRTVVYYFILPVLLCTVRVEK
jgi:hypothetical protein